MLAHYGGHVHDLQENTVDAYRPAASCGVYYLNRHVPQELVNFIYYKISKGVSILLMPVRTRWSI